MTFEERGFELVGLFDRNADKMQDLRIKGLSVYPVEDLEVYCKEVEPKVAVLCIPSEATSEVVDKLVALGIKNFWNFSHYDIASNYSGVTVENVHLNDSLMTLSYQIMNREENAE